MIFEHACIIFQKQLYFSRFHYYIYIRVLRVKWMYNTNIIKIIQSHLLLPSCSTTNLKDAIKTDNKWFGDITSLNNSLTISRQLRWNFKMFNLIFNRISQQRTWYTKSSGRLRRPNTIGFSIIHRARWNSVLISCNEHIKGQILICHNICLPRRNS